MTGTLDLGAKGEFLEAFEHPTRKKKAKQCLPARVSSSKDMYLQMAELGSPTNLQENFSRVVRDLSDLRECEYAAEYDVDCLPNSISEHRQKSRIVFEEPSSLPAGGGHGAVWILLDSLKNRMNSQAAFQEITEAVYEWLATVTKNDIDFSYELPSKIAFLSNAQRLDRIGHTDAALDLLYDSIDQLMQNGQFLMLDRMLGGLPAGEFSVDMILGILTATLPARSRLPERQKFAADAERTLRERGEYEDDLLVGLT